MELVFQHWNVVVLGTYRHAVLRLDSSAVLPCNSADKLLLHEGEDYFLANLGVGIAKSPRVLSNSFTRSASLAVFRDTCSQGAAAILLEFPKKTAGGSLGASWSSKYVSFFESSVYQTASKNRG